MKEEISDSKVEDPSPSPTPTAAESVTPTVLATSLSADKETGLDLNVKDSDKAPPPLEYPEGGFGWLVVFGAFMIQFW